MTVRPRRAADVLSPLALSMLFAAAAGAQSPRVGAVGRLDAFYASRLEWRGQSRGPFHSFFADAAGGLALGESSVTLGGWANLPVGDGIRPVPGGTAGEERDLWIQLASRFRRTGLSVGALRSEFRGVDEATVTELFGRAELPAGRWAPAVSAWLAVDGAKGLYLEPSLPFYHLVSPFAGPAFSWITTLSGGFQIGERQRAGEPLAPGPLETGLVHLTLATAGKVTLGLGPAALTVALAPRLTHGQTPRTSPGRADRELRFVFPVEAGVTVPLRRQQ